MDYILVELKNNPSYTSIFNLPEKSFILYSTYNNRISKRTVKIYDSEGTVYLNDTFIDKDEIINLNKNFDLLGSSCSIRLLPKIAGTFSEDYLNWANNYSLVFAIKVIDK